MHLRLIVNFLKNSQILRRIRIFLRIVLQRRLVNEPLAASKSSPLAIINNYFTSLEKKGRKAGAK